MKKEKSIKEFMDSEEYIQRNLKLKEEINLYPVKIDRSCFQKTKEEKEELKNLKSEYKRTKK